MSNETHTPGPWEECANLIRTARTAEGGGYLVAEVPVNTRHSLADARLIATAPELLALANLVIAGATIETSPVLLGEAHRLVAKATGIVSQPSRPQAHAHVIADQAPLFSEGCSSSATA